MTRLSQLFLLTVVVAATWTLAAGSHAVFAQDGGKRQAGAKREAREQARDQAREQEDAAREKLHAERLANWEKLYPAAKVTLAAAVEAAEKSTKSRAYDVEYRLDRDGKLVVTVGVVANDKFWLVDVDPESGEAKPATEETEPDPNLGEVDDEDE